MHKLNGSLHFSINFSTIAYFKGVKKMFKI